MKRLSRRKIHVFFPSVKLSGLREEKNHQIVSSQIRGEAKPYTSSNNTITDHFLNAV
jgi:hypothetical protein